MKALIGWHNLDNLEETGANETLVWSIVIHPDWNFNSEKYDADISVLVLTDSIEFSSTIRPVSLPSLSYSEVSGLGTVVGWGKSESSGQKLYDPIPSKVLIPAVNSSHCYTTFYQLGLASSNRHFCGGYENQGKAPCLGDSGGGFYIQDRSSWIIRGIVSASLIDAGHGCDINKFSLYTNVARFVDWIAKVMKETSAVKWKSVELKCKQEDSNM